MREDLGGDQAEGGADRAALEVGVDAEAGVAGDRVGEVELPVRLQPLALVVVEDRVDDLARVLPASGRGKPSSGDQAAAHADHRRDAGGEVEVGRAAAHRPPSRTSAKSKCITCSYRSGAGRLSRCASSRGRATPVPVTRATSAIEVRPWRTFSRPSSRRRRMPLRTATSAISVGGRALDRQRPDLLGDGHHLVEADPALVAGAAAARAADRLVGLDVDVGR